MALLFFFQAEDGIRDADVTGVQTCALPIWSGLSTWRGDGTWSRNRGSYTITYDGKRGVDFKASSGPSWAARPRRFDGRHGRAKVFTHRLRVGTDRKSVV